MIQRRTAINVAAFFVIAVLLVIWGTLRTFGNPLQSHTHLSAVFPETGGLHPNFPVSYNGVVVGKVTSVKLAGDKVRVAMSLDHGTEVPGDVRARVIRASAAGEQRVELAPVNGGTAPPLKDGAVVPAGTNPVPPDVATVLQQVTDLFKALPVDKLNQIIHESAVAVRGRATDLQSLVTSANTLLRGFLAHQTSFKQLVGSLPQMLDDLTAVSPQFRSALDNTAVLTKLLADRRYDLVRFFSEGDQIGRLGDQLTVENRANFMCIYSDFADVLERFRGQTLADFNKAFVLSDNFFGLIPNVAIKGYMSDIGLGAKGRDGQTFLRAQLLVPPAPPFALAYKPFMAITNTHPGAACHNVYGDGVGPVTQNPMPKIVDGGKIVPPAPGDEEAPDRSNTGPASVTDAKPVSLKANGAAPLADRPSTNDRPPDVDFLVLLVAAAVVLWAVVEVAPRVRDRRRRA